MSFWQTCLQYICFKHLPMSISTPDSFQGATYQILLPFQVYCLDQLRRARRSWIIISLTMQNNHFQMWCREIQCYTNLIQLERPFAWLSQVQTRWRSKSNFLVLSMQHKATWCSLHSLGCKLMYKFRFCIPLRLQPKNSHYHCFK